MEIGVIVCDIDQEVGRATRRYTLESDGRKATVDLCEEHAAVLEQVLEPKLRAVRERAPRKAATRKRAVKAAPKPSKVVSLDEIEALKQQRA